MAQTYTEFCCRSGGSNLSAGTRTGSSTEPGTSAALTYASGAWANATRIFTPASGNPVTDGVAVNDYAALDTGTGIAVLIGRVSAVSSTTITLGGTFAGANPANGTYTLRIGGAWAGPSGATTFPFGLANLANLKDAAGDIPRLNFKNDQTYAMTAGVTMGAGIYWEGYTTSYGDGGRATMDGGTTGASYALVASASNGNWVIRNMIFAHNGSTGSSTGLSIGGAGDLIEKCVVKTMVGAGITYNTNPNHVLKSCEITGNNTSNTASTGAVMNGGVSLVVEQCFIHHNTGSNTVGLRLSGSQSVTVRESVLASNGSDGLATTGSATVSAGYSVFYANGGRGWNASGSGQVSAADNCIFESNTNVGLAQPNTTSTVRLRNCAFYNNSAPTSGTPIDDTGTITGTGTFFADAANGDFRTTPVLYGAGLASFLETVTYTKPTTSAPDVGATQHSTPGGGGALILI